MPTEPVKIPVPVSTYLADRDALTPPNPFWLANLYFSVEEVEQLTEKYTVNDQKENLFLVVAKSMGILFELEMFRHAGIWYISNIEIIDVP